jgi:hypothetical protein
MLDAFPQSVDISIHQRGAASLRYKHDIRMRVVIESKEDMKKRGVSSPDPVGSLMLSNLVVPSVGDRSRASMEHGRARLGVGLFRA